MVEKPGLPGNITLIVYLIAGVFILTHPEYALLLPVLVFSGK